MNIDFSISNQRIRVPRDKSIIAESVGYVTFTCDFDCDWDGLNKYVVFTNGGVSKAVTVVPDEEQLIPHEVLKKGKLYASFVGLASNGEEKLTTRKMLFPIIVYEAGAQYGDTAEEYSPALWEQALSNIGDLGSLATASKSSLVNAVNELAENIISVSGGNCAEGSNTGGSAVCYGTCTTSADARAKDVSCPGFELKTGAVVFVKFANAQTYNASVSSPVTLNVNSTGAYPAMLFGSAVLPQYAWQAGEAVGFIYDGTNWVTISGGYASDTYYGRVRLSSASDSSSTSAAATSSAVKAAYDLAASKTTAAQVNAMIEAYISNLDGTDVSY